VIKKYSDLRKGKTRLTLPVEGVAESSIVETIKQMNKDCRKFYTDGGYVTGAVYTADPDHWNFVGDVMKQSILTNPLHIDEFLFVT